MNQTNQFKYLYLEEEYVINYHKKEEKSDEEKRVEVIQIFGQEE